ncbi:MAG: SLC13 family permease [Bacteroidota bacterium]
MKSNVRSAQIGLILGPVLFFATLFFFHPTGLSKEANAVLATTLWMATWWITEALPISVTALLPIVLFPLAGALDIKSTTAAFGHKYIFLYMGGFVIAIAIERWNLHKRIALNIINFIGADVSKIILGFMLATAFMSMWISNTATSVMMLPIAMAIIVQLKDNPATKENETLIFGKALMLAIAYSASIGGIATLIGTPPNLVLAGIVEELYGIELSFAQWFKFGLPISLVLLFICWQYLTKSAFTFTQNEFPGGRAEVKRLLKSLGKMGYEEKIVLSVFILTAFLWIARSFLQKFLPALDDTIIAIFSGILLFLLPTQQADRKIITWQEAVKMPWGVILLFGGGMALAEGFRSSGLAAWIGTQMTLLQGLNVLLLLVFIIAAVNFLTEITSNLATTAMLLPILAPMAYSLGIHPYTLMVAATLAASCAFMLPVATPPNAVVFGSGYLRISDMVKTGIWMNLISILLLTLMVYFVLPLLWGIDLKSFPVDFE